MRSVATVAVLVVAALVGCSAQPDDAAIPEPTAQSSELSRFDDDGRAVQPPELGPGPWRCEPPPVVVRGGAQLERKYCTHYADMWGAITALGQDGAWRIQQYLATQGLETRHDGRYTVAWPEAKAQLDAAAERWRGAPEVVLVDGARATAFVDRAGNGEMTPSDAHYRAG